MRRSDPRGVCVGPTLPPSTSVLYGSPGRSRTGPCPLELQLRPGTGPLAPLSSPEGVGVSGVQGDYAGVFKGLELYLYAEEVTLLGRQGIRDSRRGGRVWGREGVWVVGRLFFWISHSCPSPVQGSSNLTTMYTEISNKNNEMNNVKNKSLITTRGSSMFFIVFV